MERRKKLDPDDLNRPDWNSLKKNYSLHDCGEAYLIGQIEEMGLYAEHWGIDERDDDGEGLIFDNKMDLRFWQPEGDYGRAAYWPSEEVPECKIDVPTETPDEITTDGGLTNKYAERWLNGEGAEIEKLWNLRGVCDIKTKSNPRWLGKFNLRHLTHYAEWAERYEVPVFLYFTTVDMKNKEVGGENIILEVPSEWDWGDLSRHYDNDDDFSLTYGECKDDARTCPIVDRTFRAPDGNLVVDTNNDYYHDLDYIRENVVV